MNVLSINKETFVDGVGARLSVYFSGCNHRCKNCHNPYSWDANEGKAITFYLDEIFNELQSNFMLNGITLSGGDPFYNPKDLLLFLKWLRNAILLTNPNLTIWVYTGYLFEYLITTSEYKECLYYIDVLVDGPYDENLPPARYRGSSNQRLILVQDSLKTNKICLLEINA